MMCRLKERLCEWLGIGLAWDAIGDRAIEAAEAGRRLDRLEEAAESLAARLDAIEAGGKGDTWASFIAEGGSVVGVECRGDYEGRVAREVRVAAIAGPMTAIQAAAVARRIFGGEAAVVVPPDSAIERPQG